MKTLFLWDIDGTLLASGGAGMAAMRRGLCDAFGFDGSFDDIEFAGRTDRWIIRRIFEKFGLAHSGANYARYVAAYLSALPATLAQSPRARVLAGARELLAAVAARRDCAQGILTGNLHAGARAKLAHHGLWEFFPFGAFADDAEHRAELGPHALRRAREHTGVAFAPQRVWIIGDTPHDIACARAIGARALALATGNHSREELSAHAPDALLPDLADAAAFWRVID